MRSSTGITLVEMMIAVAVIGILAVVAVPAYQEYSRYGDSNKCAQYIVGSRLNATNLITLEGMAVTAIDANTLGLINSNNECSGGIAVSESNGDLIVRGSIGASAVTRRFTMTRAAASGSWSCETTEATGAVIQTGSCTNIN